MDIKDILNQLTKSITETNEEQFMELIEDIREENKVVREMQKREKEGNRLLSRQR